MTQISAQRSYFPRFEASRDLSEERVSNRWPWTRWSKVQVDRPWRGSRRPRFGEKEEGERGQPVCTRRPKEENGFWPRSTKVKRPSRERTRPGVYMGAIEPVTFIREPVFVHGLSSRATDLIYPRHASLLSRRHLHMRIAAPIGHFARFLDPILTYFVILEQRLVDESWPPVFNVASFFFFFSSFLIIFFFFGSITSKSINWIPFYWLI